MPDLQGAGTDLVIVLAFLFVGWYLLGGFWQRRVRARYVRTLGEAARTLSLSRSLPTISWLGSSGFQLVVADAVDPYTKLAIVTVLVPREALALLLWSLARRRGDTVVVRADLRDPPRGPEAAPAERAARRDGGVREVSVSRRSPHLIATLDGAWVRGHDAASIASLVLRLAAQ